VSLGLDGGDEVGSDTEIDYVTRDPENLSGGWRVQSAGGPSAD
jgi:hypothetical protein